MASSQLEMDHMAEIQSQIEALIARGGPVPKTWECERQEIPGFVLDYSLQTMRQILTDLGAPDISAGDRTEVSKLP